jgi:hypothetical protein
MSKSDSLASPTDHDCHANGWLGLVAPALKRDVLRQGILKAQSELTFAQAFEVRYDLPERFPQTSSGRGPPKA